MPTDQLVLDYANSAQMRVAVATRSLIHHETFSTVIGQQEYTLNNRVLELTSIFQDGRQSSRLTTPDALAFLSGSTTWIGDASYYIFGRTLGILPVPSTVFTVELLYKARPAELHSDAEMELSGEYERVADNLALQMQMADDGQPEVAQALLQDYITSLDRLRRRQRRGHSSRFPVIGVDRWL